MNNHMKNILVSSVLVSVLLTGCATGGEVLQDKETVNKPVEQAEQQEKIYNMGEIAKVDDLEIQIVSAKYWDDIDDSNYLFLENDNVLAIEVVASNTGKKEGNVDNHHFILSDQDGN